MKLEERVVIAAEVLRQCGRARDDLIKHSADCSTIDHAWLHGEADDAASEVAGRSTIAVRMRRARRIRSVHKPAMTRSKVRRVGARVSGVRSPR